LLSKQDKHRKNPRWSSATSRKQHGNTSKRQPRKTLVWTKYHEKL